MAVVDLQNTLSGEDFIVEHSVTVSGSSFIVIVRHEREESRSVELYGNV